MILDEAVYLESIRLSARALASAVAEVGRQGALGALGAYAITKLSSSSKSLARTAWRMLLGRWMGAMYAMVQLGGIGGEQAGWRGEALN